MSSGGRDGPAGGSQQSCGAVGRLDARASQNDGPGGPPDERSAPGPSTCQVQLPLIDCAAWFSLVLAPVPSSETAPITTTAMRATSRAYSTIVAPCSSRTNLRAAVANLRIEVL